MINNLSGLDGILQNVNTAGISGHVKPDGDCIGACLALYQYIRKFFPSVDVTVYMEPFSGVYSFLEGADLVINEAPEKKHDIYFCLDCSDRGRLGPFADAYADAGVRVCIDHHVTNTGMGDHRYIIPDASSTCELMCDLIGMNRIDEKMAEALYMGIAHDTGVFRYSCTSAGTMRKAAALMEKGIDFDRIVSDTYYSKTYPQQKVLAKAILSSETDGEGKVIYSVISREEMESCGASSDDMEGIVEQLRNTEGVDTSFFVYETDENMWKVSLRSVAVVDVSSIAASFGGGGHVRAAGCNMAGKSSDIVKKILEKIKKQL